MRLWLLPLVLLYPSSAGAMECIGLTTRNLFAFSHAVFIGEVTSITTVGPIEEISFRLEQSFKLEIAHRKPLKLTQWTSSRITDYDHRFQTGSRYLVFTRDESNGSGWPAPRGYTSRFCDVWEISTAPAKKRLAELNVWLRNQRFGRGISR